MAVSTKTRPAPKVTRASRKPPKKVAKPSRSTGRKYLSPGMLDDLIKNTPIHPAAGAGADKPPFEPQED